MEGVTMTAQPTLKRHPIRGFIWGIVTGLGVGLLLMVLSIVPLSVPMLIAYTGSVAVLGAVWGTFGPAKKPKNQAPSATSTANYPTDGPQPSQPSTDPLE
jgi:hypothetical protein